ncbi:pyruvate:ferredoxin (flavodoxin) oxidoreductase [Actinomarinicola tropica]|uniref:Pyruvate:ferredoxin (Flavodoxin) oxidoreductase n=1 Tax=Actinomarinicola tropica TaxID=2789776 RepID=A0A5Q2RNJ4_9ACTN|nr:pyruvate:ferredoxin (flavodoxin) oxidoreductase [Actinomarinicola tropica]QGG95667.1 pyruvate:ferredoxin (flavodoxin) oxidoreductase [Actinomarinicola tropica]
MDQQWKCLDGNEAAARVAYALSEVIALYPITPSSPMGEHSDDWASAGRPNLWGAVPDIIEMQSEGGAAGALHGALQKGALATTFTASQGLLLMIPNMFKIAGELTPAVIHVAARSIATHALSIFGDHSDVMHARATGWTMLSAGSVQEAHDFALVAHAATLRSRVPVLHFFDGFRTSHEIDKIALLGDDDISALVRDDDVAAFRSRALDPSSPVLRGTAQNPDVFFQAREASNPFHLAVPGIVQDVFDELADRTGRRYGLVEYHGAPDAERVVVVMGSAAGALEETVDALVAAGEPVGMVRVRLFQPFPSEQLLAALPPTVRAIAVLDRTKEPGAVGEPLYLSVVAALGEAMDVAEPPFGQTPRVTGGRYGLSSKEVTPSMLKPVFDDLASARPRRHFTVGIHDDVTNLSLPIDAGFTHPRPDGEVQAVFHGLGADGTVGANKSSVKIIGEHTDLFAQGYFVYDSKKSGSVTVSHLRFGPEPIRSTYLIDGADFVACHQFGLLEKVKVLSTARHGATFLLNAPFGPEEVWDHLPAEVQREILDKDIDLWVIDAYAVAAEAGMGNRLNTVMQPCFFQLSGVLPADVAVAKIKESVEATYARRGRAVVERNFAAIDSALEHLHRVEVPAAASSERTLATGVPEMAPEFVERVTAALMRGDGDLLPVSALPVDGTFPTGTAAYEKRSIAKEIPIWDPDICIDCGKCAMVCPHATIRMKVFGEDVAAGLPEEVPHKAFRSKDLPGHRLTIQVAPDDCTGCGVCVDVCPAKSKTEIGRKAINMEPAMVHRDLERRRWDRFLEIPQLDRDLLPHDNVKGSQALQPLFEFSGACAGCGETPYIRLATQLFGDRMVVANATGCSSIYGGNLPTTPWTTNDEGRGPAWSNSLFEDNAEFGLGMRLGLDAQDRVARGILGRLQLPIGSDLVRAILDNPQETEPQIREQRRLVDQLVERLGQLGGHDAADARRLSAIAGSLVRQSIWLIGGDGWAYDIGFGGLDHVLSSGRNVNVLVLDTEVYSNTGGQASKATQRAAVAKFASGGKATGKKDLGAIARAYGNVYVAQISMGANELQTTKALLEADAWPGPSLVIAYSTCIAHGIDMSTSMSHQKDAVKSGYWPLYRFHPSEIEDGQPFRLDSSAPSIPVTDFVSSETRYAILQRTDPARARELGELLQADVDERWRYYAQLASMERTIPHLDHDDEVPGMADTTADPGREG